MSRNIKEIGKELLGKSLNSFHRKTGLTQLEKNNEMQDGILDGILSQVDDAYIEKTEQSNVIHLDGSGDGVVVLDNIEGNTMVNLWNFNSVRVNGQAVKTDTTIKIKTTDNRWSNFFLYDKEMFKPSTEYTFIIDVKKNTLTDNSCIVITSSAGSTDRDVFEGYHIGAGKTGIFKKKLTTISDFSQANYGVRSFFDNTTQTLNCEVELNIIILEGDWTNKEIPASYFTGLQSSFEEKVNDEGKYEIEILSSNKNLWNGKLYSGWGGETPIMQELGSRDNIITDFIRVKKNTTYYINIPSCTYSWLYDKDKKLIKSNLGTINAYINGTNSEDAYYMIIGRSVGNAGIDKNELKNVMISKVKNEKYVPQKQNKIKLLLNEPLRSLPNGTKDKLCIKNNKLVVERNCKEILITGDDEYSNASTWYYETENYVGIRFNTLLNHTKHEEHDSAYNCLSDRFKGIKIPYGNVMEQYGEGVNRYNNDTGTIFILSKSRGLTNLNSIKNWFRNNHTKLVIQLANPEYEEVLNEYGEPILLEGYENGTIYIDSAIVPTTTVRYTPKMESFKTLKEVNNNNIMLTNDVNDNIIPYMMDVDLMIMEKEMALMSHTYKLRRIGESDMTSMQKRTQDMLTRLIKGKTLTEQECKTRVVTYLDAGKITDAQADELMLLISEVYA